MCLVARIIIGIYQVIIKWRLGYEYHFHIKVNIACHKLVDPNYHILTPRC